MRKKLWVLTLIGIALTAVLSSCALEQNSQSLWHTLPSTNDKGLLNARVELWRNKRLWHVIDDGYLLSGYKSRPGIHAWQGEHVGKWLHAATLAYEETGDEKLGKKLKETVVRLIAAQEANGYLGTYAEKKRFYNVPDDRSWDIWSHRYNLYGLLTYERFHPDDNIVRVCEKMADLLIQTYGPGKADITKYGSRQGISSMTLLESMMMLYERTRQPRFLKFAEHIVQSSENAPKLRLMGAMLENKDVSTTGDGKAYQLMANLIGYLMLYENTGDEKYLTTVNNAWDNITEDHLYTTGGPWSLKTSYNANGECFALAQDFDPAKAKVEACSTTTWIQLNLHLLEQTGQAKYAIEAEKAIYNALMASQFGEGIDWCYYTKANEKERPFEDRISCCASSGPRALEMFSHYLIGEIDGGISLASLTPSSATLPKKFGNARIRVTGNYPLSPKAAIVFEKASGKKFDVEFAGPGNAPLRSIKINGKDIALSKNDRGFYSINNAWKTGDQVDIEFEYLLKSHIETPTEDQKWVAFTYGPWALAQKIKKDAVIDEPFIGKDVKSSDLSELLVRYPAKDSDVPLFRIENTKILLGPYYIAGNKKTGVRTYFKY